MKKAKRFICIFLSIILVVMTFSSCGKDKGEKSSDEIDDSVMIKLPVSKSDSFNPYKSETEFNNEVMSLLYDGLVKLNSDLSVTNVIASSAEVSGKSVIVELKDEIYFSNGTKLTSSDVTYSFNQAKESENYDKKLSNFKTCVNSGNNGVTFELEESDIYAVNCLDFPIVQRPADEKNEKKKDDEYVYEEEEESFEDEKIVIGSGRYRFEDESKNTLIMNEYWYGEELPKVRRIELVNLLDIGAAVSSMETGNISYLFQDLSSGIFNRVNAKTTPILMTNLVFLGINSYSTALAKPEVRQAVSLVIDKDKIVENSFLSYAVVAETPFYPLWNELKKVHLEQRNTEEDKYEAEILLDKAGYEEKTALGMRSSEEIHLKLLVNSDNAYKVSAADEIALNLKNIGITVEVSKLPWDEYVYALQSVDYDIYIGEVKLSNNMSLMSFFEEEGAVSYGINSSSEVIDKYKSMRAGQISLQRFIDYFNVSVPFVPLCYRTGIATYTNEISYETEGTQSDLYAGIYTWEY